MTNQIKAAIFDLDGVITSTATTHANAWKKMFDQYNEQREKEGKESYDAFSIETDYMQHVDGKPRYLGVKDFLASRNIILPYGDPQDPPGKETICGLGNLKNNIFLDLVDKEGVEILTENVQKAKKWKKTGCRLAVVSSSKNCRMILKSVDLEGLFETNIDGIVAAQKKYKGKPAPDIFIKAAEELGTEPTDALIVEDALAGVEAGKNGNFGLVIGIADESRSEEMKEHGADIVVENLAELPDHPRPLLRPGQLPSALESFQDIQRQYGDRNVYIFLDYDGTLTPIVDDYKAAFLSDDMRELIKDISENCPTAIITGRDLQDIKDLVRLDRMHYAGSHGFEMVGPDGFVFENEEAQKSLKKIADAARQIKDRTAHIQGVKFEKKKFALAVHYRKVSEGQTEEVKKIVYDTIRQYPEIKTGKGKKVIELKPNLNWHKGKSLRVLFDTMANKNRENNFIFYIGDDITDEDAFFEIIDDGIGILVGDHGQKTFASFHVEDVDQVKAFIQKLLVDLKK